MEAQTQVMKPVESDIASALTLAQELDRLDRDGLIQYADKNFNLTVDPALDPQTIKENLLRIHASVTNSARELNQKSLQMTIALDLKRKKAWDAYKGDKRRAKPFAEYKPNPPVEVKFFYMQCPGLNVEFANSEPYGVTAKGSPNQFGFTQIPRYNLFHGEMYVLPLLLVRHLQRLTYVTHKPVIDSATGLQNGTIPIIKPRFVFEMMYSDEDLVRLAEMKKEKKGTDSDDDDFEFELDFDVDESDFELELD